MRAKVIAVTNCFPPKVGGVETFTYEVARRLPNDAVVMVAPDQPGAASFDAQAPFPVVRWPHKLNQRALLRPGLADRIIDVAREHGCSRAWITELVPLGLLSGPMKAAGLERVVAQSHGAEILWAQLPGLRQLLRGASRGMDVATYLGAHTYRHLAPVIGKHAAMKRLAPGVDVTTFRPGVSGAAVRARHGLGDRPVVVCASRLVPRKGQDTLIGSLPAVAREVPDVHLMIVGSGSHGPKLRALAERSPLSERIIFAGEVPASELPAHYAAGDLFAMPCRSRFGGLEVEGLGMVYLEAAACGLPVVAGNSGGAPDAVIEGETGYVVDGRDPNAVADRIVRLLKEPALACRMGKAGRQWVEAEWTWDLIAARMHKMLWPEE